MDEITYSVKKSFTLLLKHWQIYAIVLLFSTQLLLNLVKLPSVVSLFFSLLSLGWLGTRFEFIKNAYEKGRLPWNQFGSLIIKYIKRLFPIALLLMIIAVILFFVIFIYYAKWHLGDAFFLRDKGIRKQQIVDIFNSLRNPQIMQEFISQFGVLVLIARGFLILLGSLATISLSILVIDTTGIIKSFLKGISFIKYHLQFFVVMILINIVISVIYGWIWSFVNIATLGSQTHVLLVFLIGIPNRFFNLIIEATTVIYYLETKKYSIKKTER